MTDRWPPGRFVVVSGPPASGKTTLARALAPALGLPLIAKDTIKQALMTVLPVPDVPASRTIGTASVAALLAVAAEAPAAVLESVWHRSYAATDLGNLPGSLVEVFCRCDPAVAAQRYARRAGTRAAGHFDAERTIGELWNDDVAQPVAGGWPVIEVDTTARVDITSLVERIRAAVAVPPAGPPGAPPPGDAAARRLPRYQVSRVCRTGLGGLALFALAQGRSPRLSSVRESVCLARRYSSHRRA